MKHCFLALKQIVRAQLAKYKNCAIILLLAPCTIQNFLVVGHFYRGIWLEASAAAGAEERRRRI